MRSKIDRNNFIRFLKDEKFIEWKLFPTDELNRYWEEYLQINPHEKNDVLLAEKHFRSIDLSSFGMPREKKREVTKRLIKSLKIYKQKNKIKHLIYISAACAAMLLLSMLFIKEEANRSRRKPLELSSDYIVGSELESEDILFVTGSKTTYFQSNVNIRIDGNKTAQIRSEDQKTEAKEISIEQHTMNKLIVPYGKRSNVILSDGTQVWLNSGSSLEFPSAFSKERREVFLAGEMYIEVSLEKNRPFYVHTSNYDVKVHGTKFNVSSYTKATSSVVLVEGSIGLQTTNKEEVLLSPNQQAIYSEETEDFDKKEVNVHSYISWKEGYLVFDDTPVVEALKQIERYYNLSFNYGDDVSFSGLTCTGKIILSDNLDNVMMALTLISDTKFNKKDKLIYIYKK